MRSHVRVSLVALIVSASVAVAAPAAQAEFGIEAKFAANCNVSTCGEFGGPPLKNSELFTQAAGHPPAGITAFKIDAPGGVPSGIVTHVRTDVGVGVSTNPEAVAKCSFEEFGKEEPLLPGSGLFGKPACKAESKIGFNSIVVFTGASDLPLPDQPVYNLVQPTGLASDFGVALELPILLTKAKLHKVFEELGHPYGEPTEKNLEGKQYWAHTLIEGGVEWGAEPSGTGQADYHDYYEINVSPELPLISSRLVLEGDIGTTGKGGFITNPSSCTGTGAQTTTTFTVTPQGGPPVKEGYDGPLGTEGCKGESPFTSVPFAPAFSLTPETTQSDQPDGLTTELSLPHDPSPTGIDSSQLKTASITLPEGVTLNPAAAAGLEACTETQIGIGTKAPIACPNGSKIGTVALEVPTLPPGSLTGSIYLGSPKGGPITGPPYIMYLNAESARYGVDVNAWKVRLSRTKRRDG